MTLFEFAETAEDSELHDWHSYKHCTEDEWAFVHHSGQNRPLLFSDDHKQRIGITDNCTPEVARMYFQFVALEMGENPNA